MMKKLSEIEKRDPFGIPENYFEEVNRKILASTTGPVILRNSGKKFFYFRMRPFLTVAASIAVFIVFGYTALKILSHERTNKDLSEISLQDLPDSFLEEFDLITLEENVGKLVQLQEISDISRSEIIDYLLMENAIILLNI